MSLTPPGSNNTKDTKDNDPTPDAPAYAAHIGVDWAKERHAVALQPAGGGEPEESWLGSSPGEVHAWARALGERFGGSEVAVGVELSRGALVEELRAHPHIALYPLNPATTSGYRGAFTPSGAKDDMPDARICLELVRDHRGRIRPLAPKPGADRKLELLVAGRRKLVDIRTRLTNILRSTLEAYYPLAIEISGSLGGKMGCKFLQRWPEHRELARARPETLRKFYHACGSRSEKCIDARLEEIAAAEPVTDDRGYIEGNAALATALAAQLKALGAQVDKLDAAIATAFAAHPDRAVWASFPGAGAALAARLAAAWGTRREAYPSATDMQLYSGVAPVTERSGKSSWTHRRYSRPEFIHQTFWEYAGQSALRCGWAKSYVQAQVAKGKKRSTALRSLAFKWIRVMHACWTAGVEYDDARYARVLREKDSPFAPPEPPAESAGNASPAATGIAVIDNPEPAENM